MGNETTFMTIELPLIIESSTAGEVNRQGADGVSNARIELFVRLIGLHQHQIHRYLLSLVPHAHDADDLLQDTNLFLWREFHRFEEGTNFVAWACSVAFHEVMAWRKRRSRDRLVFSEQFLQAVSGELNASTDRVELRSRALANCVSELRESHRELLRLRYADGSSIEGISSELGRTTDAVYRMLSRIRHILFECISRKIEAELV